MVQIGMDPEIYDRQYLIDARAIKYEILAEFMDRVLVKPRPLILGQNFAYDWQFLAIFYKIFLENIRDTMLFSQVIRAGRPGNHKLSGLLRYFLRGEFIQHVGMTPDEYDWYKDTYQSSSWGDDWSEDQLNYAAIDVRCLFPLFERMKAYTLRRIEQRVFHPRINERILQECRILPAYASMSLTGVPSDVQYIASDVIPYLQTKAKEAEDEVGKFFYTEKEKSSGRGKNKVITTVREPLKVRSPKVKEVLSQILGFDFEDAKEKTLKRYMHKHPGIPAILQARKAKFLLSSFGQKLIDLTYTDGRLRPKWFQIGSEGKGIRTSRNSCSKPNMQQMPQKENLFGERKASKVFRRLVKAGPGNKIYSFDYSTIEPRAIAQESMDPVLIAELQRPDCDLHAMTAQMMLGLDYRPARGSDEREKIGKIANLGLGYMMGPKNFAKFMFDNTGGFIVWDIEQAKAKIDLYYSKLHRVKARQEYIEACIRRKYLQHNTLADFTGGKTIYIQWATSGRHREFVLEDDEEEMSRDRPEALHKWYKDIDEDGNRTQNIYWRKFHQIVRQAYNFTIQGLCADIMKLAIEGVHQRLTELGICPGIIAVVHDEIVLEAPEDMEDIIVPLVTEEMIKAGEAWIKVVPIVVEWSSGYDWGACK